MRLVCINRLSVGPDYEEIKCRPLISILDDLDALEAKCVAMEKDREVLKEIIKTHTDLIKSEEDLIKWQHEMIGIACTYVAAASGLNPDESEKWLSDYEKGTANE